jgi:hypothetical protein
MADDTTTDGSTQDTGTGTDETSTGTDDLAGLKSALASEREQRKAFEKAAKTNSSAAAELEKLKAQSMSETEKAVAAAKAEGETSAAVKYGQKLARAEFKAAVASKGLDLGEALDLIDTTRFVDEAGDVDEDAIKKAVAKLAKLAPKTPGASGGDFSGGNGGASGNNRPTSIREAYARKQT